MRKGVDVEFSKRAFSMFLGVSRLKLLSMTSGVKSLALLQIGFELMALSISQSSLRA